jgi:uncharacterized protein (TIGR02996 family)
VAVSGIGDAARLWAAGDREGALEALCGVWAQTQDLELAELCEHISEFLVRERTRSLARELSPEQVRASLIGAARAGDRVAVHALLPWLTALARPKARQRLALLEPPDPALLRGVVQWLRRRPELNELAQYLVNQRSLWVEFQSAWCRRESPLERDRYAEDSSLWRSRFSGLVRSPRALNPADAAALASFRAAFDAERSAGREQAAALLDAAREHPDDDARRALLADFLLSHDEHDPRGEFINLQLRAAAGPVPEFARARERELLDLHGLRWLGPLVRDCMLPSVRFERGFLSGLDLIRPRSNTATFGSPGHPIWATVERLNRGSWEIIGHPIMRSLRTVGCDPSCARALLSGPVRAKISSLTVAVSERVWSTPDDHQPDLGPTLTLARELFAQLDAAPNLRHLGLRDSIPADPESWQWFWQGPRAGLESVRLRIDRRAAPRLWEASELLRRDDSSVQLQLDYGVLSFTLLPADRYRTVRVNHNVPHWRARPSPDELLGFIVNALAPCVSATRLRRIEIVGAIVDADRLRDALDEDAIEVAMYDAPQR